MPGCFKVILVAVPKIIGYGKYAEENLDSCGESQYRAYPISLRQLPFPTERKARKLEL